MFRNSSAKFIVPVIFLFLAPFLASTAVAQESCFPPEARRQAEQTAKVFREPDPGYNPVLGYNPAEGPRRGAPPVGSDGLAHPINSVPPIKTKKRTATTPQSY